MAMITPLLNVGCTKDHAGISVFAKNQTSIGMFAKHHVGISMFAYPLPYNTNIMVQSHI